MHTRTSLVLRLAALGVAASGFLPHASAQVLFTENWESGSISPAAWKAGGSPLPGLNSGPLAQGSFSMINNGDGSHESGLVTVETFTVVAGLRFDVSTFTQTGAIWSVNRIWLTAAPLSDFGAELYGAHYGPHLLFLGDTPGQKVTITDGPSGAGAIYNPDVLNRWVDSTILFNADGSVSYFVDHTLLYTSSAGWLDYSLGDEIRLALSGRSNGVTNLADGIRVSIDDSVPGTAVPEPATSGLLGVGACLLLLTWGRRRRR